MLAAVPPRFNMVALHWQGSGVPLFRTRSVSGRWSPWRAADDDWGRSGRWRMQGVPAWTGAADAIQYRSRGRVTRMRAYFLWSPVDRAPTRRLAITGGPTIIPRAGWEADESIRRAPPVYAGTLRFALVHHTVTSNAYSRSQSAAIVRGIEIYHVKGNGWNDIGYNFLVDKYGQIFEGRYGGVERNVVGAHSQGVNTGSVGIAVIGTYTRTGVSPAAKTALEQLLAWRLDVAHVDPLSTVAVRSGGNSRFRAGRSVSLHAISGHRDTYPTECPGNALYAQLPGISRDVGALGLPKLYAPIVSGKLGGPIRFTGRLSSSLPWTVTVVSRATGLTVASGSGTGAVVDWTWDATLAPPVGYIWRIDAGASVRPASGTIGGGKAVALAITDTAATPAVTSAATVVGYSLSVAATVTATLVDPTGATVAQLFTGQKPAGMQSLAVTISPTLPDGMYAVVLDAQTRDGQHAEAVVNVQVDRTILAFAVSPLAISPNGDGVQDAATVTFTPAVSTAVGLELEQNGVPMVTLASGTYPAGVPVTVTWDGTIAGAPAPDGVYTIALEVGAALRTIEVTVDTQPPGLQPLSWSDLRFAMDEVGTVTLEAGGRTWVRAIREHDAAIAVTATASGALADLRSE
jgi:hypothetical protein